MHDSTAKPGSACEVELVRGGVVRSSFTVTCADALANPELVLQEPPETPPAAPFKKDFKGHVTLLKGFDDGEPEALGKEFKGHVTLLKRGGSDGGAALGKYTKSGHVTLLKRGGSDDSAASARTPTKTGHVTFDESIR